MVNIKKKLNANYLKDHHSPKKKRTGRKRETTKNRNRKNKNNRKK